WFAALFTAHTDRVKEGLLHEMDWELAQPRTAHSAGYVFSRMRWTSIDLGRALRDDIIQVLQNNPAADLTALIEALTVFLRNPASLPQSLLDMLSARVGESGDDNVKALWLAGLLCTDAARALPVLEEWVSGLGDAAAQEARISMVLEHVWGDSFHGLNSE